KRAGTPFETGELNNHENSLRAFDLGPVICRQYFFKLSYCCGWGVMGNSLCSAPEPAIRFSQSCMIGPRATSNLCFCLRLQRQTHRSVLLRVGEPACTPDPSFPIPMKGISILCRV